MKRTTYIITIFIITITLFGCNEVGNKSNPLYGKVFRDIEEIPELKNYKDIGGAVINSNKYENGDYRFGIAQLRNKNNQICILEEFIKSDIEGQVKYKILDTIQIQNIKGDEFVTYCNCRKDKTWDYEIIALVNADEETEFYNKIITVWRADTKTGKIYKINNTKDIDCMNEGFGVD